MTQPIRVVIVEDEPNVARTLARALALAGGGKYAADICSCPEAALSELAEHGCEIVLIGLEVPGMDGAKFLMRVREVSPGTRSILMTGRGASHFESFANLPAEGYLLKPFGLNDFLEVVGRLVRDPRHDAV